MSTTIAWKRERERGAALVEAAIVVPILIALLFGIIDFGFMFNDYLAVRQGTREGARQAAVSTKPMPPTGTWASNGCVTGVNSGTNLDGYDLVCFVKDRLGLKQSDTRVKIFFVPQSGSKPFAAGQGVTVCTQYPAKSITGFATPFLAGRVLQSKVEIRIEQDSTWATPVAETPLTSWPASCDSV
jgi:hypothetical protein